MRRLLRADLAALRNAVRRRENRRPLLLGIAIGAVFVASVTAGTARLLLSRPVRHAMRDVPEQVGPPLLALLVLVSLAFAGASTFVTAGRFLFESRTTELLLCAPIPRRAIVGHALLRSWLSGLGLALAIGLPAAALFGARYGLAPLVLPAFVGVVAALLLPVTAAMLVFQVVAKRLSPSPRWRVLVNVVVFTAGTAIALAVGGGLLLGREELEAFVGWLQRPRATPAWIADVAALLGATAGLSGFEPRALRPLLAPALALPCVWIATRLLPGAWEHSRIVPGAARPRRAAARPGAWPRGVAASVARKDLAVTLRARGTFAAFGVMALIAVLFETTSLYRRAAPAALPVELLHALELLTAFTTLAMALAALQGAGMLADEAGGLELIAASPAPRRSVLLGKLPALALPHVWLVLVIAVTAPLVRDTGRTTAAWFLATAPPVLASIAAATTAVATLPALHPAHGSAGATAFLRLLASTLAAIVPTTAWFLAIARARRHLTARFHDEPGAGVSSTLAVWVAGSWLAAAALVALFLLIAARNVRALFGPRG